MRDSRLSYIVGSGAGELFLPSPSVSMAVSVLVQNQTVSTYLTNTRNRVSLAPGRQSEVEEWPSHDKRALCLRRQSFD